MKHRQEAIVETLTLMKPPANVPRPGLFLKKQIASLESHAKAFQSEIAGLRQQLSEILAKPAELDPVYRIVVKLFQKRDEVSLKEASSEYLECEEAARKRYLLGYPPRKKNDTSLGDLLNWEWIKRCARSYQSCVHLVSRDSDFGLSFEGRTLINDQLREEFASATKGADIFLHTKLSDALRAMNIAVSKEDAEAEAEIASERVFSGWRSAFQFNLEDALRNFCSSASEPGLPETGRPI